MTYCNHQCHFCAASQLSQCQCPHVKVLEMSVVSVRSYTDTYVSSNTVALMVAAARLTLLLLIQQPRDTSYGPPANSKPPLSSLPCGLLSSPGTDRATRARNRQISHLIADKYGPVYIYCLVVCAEKSSCSRTSLDFLCNVRRLSDSFVFFHRGRASIARLLN